MQSSFQILDGVFKWTVSNHDFECEWFHKIDLGAIDFEVKFDVGVNFFFKSAQKLVFIISRSNNFWGKIITKQLSCLSGDSVNSYKHRETKYTPIKHLVSR